MKEYATIESLKNDFISGKFTPNQPVKVDDVVYETAHTSSHERFSDIITENTKGVVVYECSGAHHLLFLWGANGNSIVPYDVRTTMQQVFEQEIEDRIIPDKVEVHFLNLPVAGSLIAKVDTGAEMCSLHAENVQIDRGERKVSFVCPQLSHSRITSPITDQQAIKTSGGQTTYRAVITTTIKIKGKVLKDIEVNLNDRGEMDDPMLVGQNALQAGKFLIDPTIIKEGISDELMAALQRENITSANSMDAETAQKIYEAMSEVGDISIADLMKVLRTQVLKNIDKISY